MLVGQVLRRIEPEALARRDEELAVAREGEARAEMVAAGHLRLLPEDHRRALERRRRLVETTARDRGRGAALAGLGEGQIDEPARREIGRQRDVEKPALSLRVDARHAREGRRHLAVRRDEPQPARPLGHQHASVRQEGETPRVVEAAGDGLDQDLGLVGLEACLRRRRREERARQQGQDNCGAGKHSGPPARFGTAPSACRHINAPVPPPIRSRIGDPVGRPSAARAGAGSLRRRGPPVRAGGCCRKGRRRRRNGGARRRDGCSRNRPRPNRAFAPSACAPKACASRACAFPACAGWHGGSANGTEAAWRACRSCRSSMAPVQHGTEARRDGHHPCCGASGQAHWPRPCVSGASAAASQRRRWAEARRMSTQAMTHRRLVGLPLSGVAPTSGSHRRP